MPNLYVALTHYPVVNKNGSTIVSAVTNLDLHDMSRAVKTYGVQSLYVITPLTDQKALGACPTITFYKKQTPKNLSQIVEQASFWKVKGNLSEKNTPVLTKCGVGCPF